MTNKPIIPIFKASIVNEDQLIDLKGINYKICHEQGDRWQGCDTNILCWQDIDVSTIRISLDGGATFRTLEEVDEALNVYDNCKNNVETIKAVIDNEQ